MARPEPYEYGDWVEDYHQCVGEYGCEVVGLLCPLDDFDRRREAARAGRFRRPREHCPTCGQETGLLVKEESS